MTQQWARLGPLGALRDIPNPAPEVQVASSRAVSELVTLDGLPRFQRGPRAARAWSLAYSWLDVERAAYLSACAQGAVRGPLYLVTEDMARTNLFAEDLAAPGALGFSELGSTFGAVPLGMADAGIITSTGVQQAPTTGPWSRTVPVRRVAHTLSVWASAVGAALEWRTVNASGAQASTGTLTAVATSSGFRASASLTPSATAVGIQVRIAAGTRVVGALRLTEGTHAEVWHPGNGAAKVMVDAPTQTLQAVWGGPDHATRADYTFTLREEG